MGHKRQLSYNKFMIQKPEGIPEVSPEEPQPPKGWVGDPFATLEAILQEMRVTGNIDFEPDTINRIANALRAGKITAEEAIEQARDIQNNRQER